MNVNAITEAIIGAAIEVRRALCHELHLRGLTFVTEQPLPVIHKGLRLDCGFRVNLIVAEAVVVENQGCRTFWRRYTTRSFSRTCVWRLEGGSLDRF